MGQELRFANFYMDFLKKNGLSSFLEIKNIRLYLPAEKSNKKETFIPINEGLIHIIAKRESPLQEFASGRREIYSFEISYNINGIVIASDNAIFAEKNILSQPQTDYDTTNIEEILKRTGRN